MKQPSDLTREELEDIVSQVRNILWKDYSTDKLDPDRSWNSETIEWVSGVLEDAGPKPDRVVHNRPATEEAAAPGPTSRKIPGSPRWSPPCRRS